MEAARTLIDLPERMRMRRFTAECEGLRPLGVSYALRHFGHSLDLADAEDAVSEVVIRFHRLALAGREPSNLRAAFFTSVRNASIDLLRSRGVRPTVPLEAAAAEPAAEPGPSERAEAHDDVVRLREAMARMRPNYREAIVLRFGLGLTVPEIAQQLQMSLPAAKKLVLRSTGQIRDRMSSIDGKEFCPEMREIARHSIIDGEVADLGDEAEQAAIKAHLEHCGPCRTYLASLRSTLHELGSGVLLAGLAAGKLGLLGRLSSVLHAGTGALHSATGRLRLASYRAGGAFAPEGGNSAGLLAGTGQKLAAVCTAGAGAAACVATGIVGPGIGIGVTHRVQHHPVPAPAAHVRKVRTPIVHHAPVTYSEPSPTPEAASTEAATSEHVTGTAPRPRGGSKDEAKKPKPTSTARSEPETKQSTPSQTEQSEFGFEEESSAPVEAAPEPEAPVTDSRPVESSPAQSAPTPEAAKTGSSGSGGGHDEFGFGG
jgi:RNA polymerase sigma factor (sigma-70 family)